MAASDARFTMEDWDASEKEDMTSNQSDEHSSGSSSQGASESHHERRDESGEPGSSGEHQKIVKPLSPEEISAFNAAQEKAGIIYISRIPPGMRPSKVRHLMSHYGEIGRVYLQQEDPRRAYLRKKHTATKKVHYTEGWVEFTDKKVARTVAEMLNAQPIGGKKGTRWRDDVWTMKYLPRFKWNILTEHVAHEAATHSSRLRIELSQSKVEQKDYLRQVEMARQLDKRAEKKRKREEQEGGLAESSRPVVKTQRDRDDQGSERQKKSRRHREERPREVADDGKLVQVLGQVF